MRTIVVALLCSVAMMACSPLRSARVYYSSLDVEEFARYIEHDDVVLVDVRTPEEYAAGHLEGVDYNLDVRGANFFKEYQTLPKEKTIALYCKGGGRSKQVAGVLAGNGYRVIELNKGYNGWVEAGRKTIK